jgi:hypothetical protein
VTEEEEASLAELVLLTNEIAKQQGLYVGIGKDMRKEDTFEAQTGPHWKRITALAQKIVMGEKP